MVTLRNVKAQIEADSPNWRLYLMDFVDDFRAHQQLSAIAQPIDLSDNRMDAMLASTAQYLCEEQQLPCPDWLYGVPACKDPWFVAGLENLKAIALVESPLYFRIRKIFVLENFLSRV